MFTCAVVGRSSTGNDSSPWIVVLVPVAGSERMDATPGIGIIPGRGEPLFPTMLQGRAPRRADRRRQILCAPGQAGEARVKLGSIAGQDGGPYGWRKIGGTIGRVSEIVERGQHGGHRLDSST